MNYPRTDPVVIAVVSDGDRLLMGRQPSWPKGRYSALAGFVEPGPVVPLQPPSRFAQTSRFAHDVGTGVEFGVRPAHRRTTAAGDEPPDEAAAAGSDRASRSQGGAGATSSRPSPRIIVCWPSTCATGGAEAPGGDYSMATFADPILALIDAERIDRVADRAKVGR